MTQTSVANPNRTTLKNGLTLTLSTTTTKENA